FLIGIGRADELDVDGTAPMPGRAELAGRHLRRKAGHVRTMSQSILEPPLPGVIDIVVDDVVIAVQLAVVVDHLLGERKFLFHFLAPQLGKVLVLSAVATSVPSGRWNSARKRT